MILNKDAKGSGGCTCFSFSTNVNAIKRREINATYRALLRSRFHKHINYQLQKYKHPDLNPSRIRRDANLVQKILSTIDTTFIDPLSLLPLISISTGVMVTYKVTSDMISAKTLGKKAMDEFITSRLSNRTTAYFFDPIDKLNLVTFTSMNKIKTCRVNSKFIPLQASKNLFAKIALDAQIRSLNLRLVFKFPIGPLPWSLSEPIRTLKKTPKAALLHKLEGKVKPIENEGGEYAMIIDGMVYVQQAQVSSKTFGQLAMDLLNRILLSGMRAARTDVVLDQYRNLSI